MRLLVAVLLLASVVAAQATTAKFVPLTRPDGSTTYLLPGMVIDIAPAGRDCKAGSGSYLRTLAGTLCVKETPAEAVDKLKEGL